MSAGRHESKLLITTSREPSRRTRSFIKDLVTTIPHAVKFNRGKATLLDLSSIARRTGAYGVLIVLEKKANPSALTFHIPEPDGLKRVSLLKITSVKLMREMPDSQKPLGINRIIMNLEGTEKDELLAETAEELIRALRPEITQHGAEAEPAIEIILGRRDDGVVVNFVCTSTGRPCGPRFIVTKVIRYDRQ